MVWQGLTTAPVLATATVWGIAAFVGIRACILALRNPSEYDAKEFAFYSFVIALILLIAVLMFWPLGAPLPPPIGVAVVAGVVAGLITSDRRLSRRAKELRMLVVLLTTFASYGLLLQIL